MPRFRQDPTTKEWVICATARAKRPDDFIRRTSETLIGSRKRFHESTPFACNVVSDSYRILRLCSSASATPCRPITHPQGARRATREQSGTNIQLSSGERSNDHRGSFLLTGNPPVVSGSHTLRKVKPAAATQREMLK